MKKLNLTILLLICFTTLKVFPNAAAPGFFNIGGAKMLSFFYPKDSISIQKIQMQSEQITILLYKGFAVVKGEYYMLNLSDEEISIHTGYPINSYYSDNINGRYSIDFEILYNMRVLVNSDAVEVKTLTSDSTSVNSDDKKNWYVWNATYKPKTITKLTVYFIVATNNAIVRRGYNRDNVNGFAYLLESGNAWAKDIEKGRIYIKLMDNQTLNNLSGLKPDSIFKANELTNELIYDFTNLEPTSKNNILIRYSTKISNFNINDIVTNAEKYFNEIDKIDASIISTSSFKPIYTGDIFKVYDSSAGGMLYIIAAIILIPILVIVGVTVLIVKFIRRRKQNN